MTTSRCITTVLAAFALSCSSSTPATPGDGGVTQVQGIELMRKLAGLWSGPATDTRLGNFPLKNMDLRPASDSVLFGRVDLDAENSLRFAFAAEVHGGTRVLVFRNGGLFRGLSRDTRTRLIESDGTTYRFCAISGGCDYVDAEFRFSGETAFELRVNVRNMLHERWTPTRVETREVPAQFPARTDLPPDGAFPQMPTATVQVRWSTPLATPTDVWLVLTTTPCVPSGGCQFSRFIKAVSGIGATEATLHLDQVHAGNYSALAVVDSNGNLDALRAPDSGDLISVPSPTLSIGASGDTAGQLSANLTLP